MRAAYVAMNLIGQYTIVPLSLLAAVTGLIQALTTPWGLARYYWVLTKFFLTIAATALLVLHQFTAVAEAARLASASTTQSLPSVGRLGVQLIVDSGGAVVLLIVTTILSIYKPWGKTSYGRRTATVAQTASVNAVVEEPLPFGLRIFLGVIGAIVVTILAIHAAGGGLHHH